MSRLKGDVKFAFRMLAKYPGFSVLSIFAMALGMHLVTGQLLVINGLLFKELPLPDEGRLVAVVNESGEKHKAYGALPPLAVETLNAKQSTMVGLSAFYSGTVNLVDSGRPRRFDGAFIMPNFLDLIGAELALGDGFQLVAPGKSAEREILISHDLWRSEFGGSRNVIGRTIKVNAEPARIVGVMPAGLRFPVDEDVWIRLDAVDTHPAGEPMWVNVFGRLKPGIDREDAAADLNKIVLSESDGDEELWNWCSTLELPRYSTVFLDPEVRNMLWIMLGAVFLVLFIGCANVANLLLARSTIRVRELAVRSAVGATRARLVRQMLVESLVLCLIGSVIGLITAAWSIDLVTAYLSQSPMPFWMVIGFDASVVLSVLGVTVFASIVAGIVPAARASRADVNELLKDSARTSTNRHTGWIVRGLVAAQVAMSFSLLIVAGVMVMTVSELRNVSVAYDLAKVGSARFGLFAGDYPESGDVFRFLGKLQATLAAENSVTGAAVTRRQRFDSSPVLEMTIPGGKDDEETRAGEVVVEEISSGYFEALGVNLIAGREFTHAEWRDGAAVVVVNESFTREWLGGGNPIGRKVTLKAKQRDLYEIIGVAPDLQSSGVALQARPASGVYMPIRMENGRFFTMLYRTLGDGEKSLPVLRRAISRLNPELPLYWLMTYAQALDQSLVTVSLAADIFAVFGLAAMLLAAIGIYGVVSFTVSQRTPEIGIRMALGARRQGIVSMILKQGVVQLLVGLAAGAAIAVGMERLLVYFVGSMPVFGFSVFLSMGVVVSGVVLVSSFLPARKAARLSPFDALRHE